MLWTQFEQDETQSDWTVGFMLVIMIISVYFPRWRVYRVGDNKRSINRIAMISSHGYFDIKPILGRTDTGGQIIYILNLVKALHKKGYKVDIYTRWFDDTQKQIENVPDCDGKCKLIRIRCGPWKFIQKELLYPYLNEFAKNMMKFIKQNDLNYDLYHGHYCDGGIITLDLAATFEKPSLFTSHSLGIWKKQRMLKPDSNLQEMEQKYKFKKRINSERQIINNVNGIITTTKLETEKMRELMDFDGNNIYTIPCGVNTNYFKPISPGSEIANKQKYVFCLSRIDTNKGHDLLLYAWSIVLKYFDADIHLIIGGGSKNVQQQTDREKSVIKKMRSIIKEYKMENNVHYIGYCDHYNDVLPLYQNCEFFVVPSLFEPFGITALEAMSCGKCVIATKYGGISTIITHEQDGLLVDTTNANEFASHIIRLLKDNELRQKLESNAYKTVHEQYTWNIIAEKHIKIYGNL